MYQIRAKTITNLCQGEKLSQNNKRLEKNFFSYLQEQKIHIFIEPLTSTQA